MKAAVSSNESCSTTGWCKSCGNKRCLTCQQILNTQTFTCHSTGSVFTIFCNVTCKTQNVVYILQCRCGMQYVGETEQPFNKRMNGHRSDYTCKPDLPVSRHLRSHGHDQADLKKTYHHHHRLQRGLVKGRQTCSGKFLDKKAQDSFPRGH